jgi:hypothetical protein
MKRMGYVLLLNNLSVSSVMPFCYPLPPGSYLEVRLSGDDHKLFTCGADILSLSVKFIKTTHEQ